LAKPDLKARFVLRRQARHDRPSRQENPFRRLNQYHESKFPAQRRMDRKGRCAVICIGEQAAASSAGDFLTMVSKTLRIRIARFGRHLLLAGAGAMSMTSPAWADRAWSWLPLKPDAPASADGAAFETLFYSRTASFDGLARLTEPFQPVPGDAAKGEIASGTLLYRVRTEKETYYCSAKRLRKMTEGDKWSGVWRAPLWQFGLASISPGDTMPQCFQDADGGPLRHAGDSGRSCRPGDARDAGECGRQASRQSVL
jgi:hypothetical protein